MKRRLSAIPTFAVSIIVLAGWGAIPSSAQEDHKPAAKPTHDTKTVKPAKGAHSTNKDQIEKDDTDAEHADAPADKSPATADHDTKSAAGHATPAKAVSPDEALWRLTQGNQRFSSGHPVRPRTDQARRGEVAGGQHPFATVLACADSRVAVERLFDQGIGDVFVVRVAGNIAGTDEVGTIEYGVGHLHTPLVVVMGHTACGAVGAAAANTELEGSIPEVIKNIRPAVRAAQVENPSLPPSQLAARVVETNVWQSIADMLRASEEIREHLQHEKVRIVGAVYELETGKVKWLGPHPDQASLLAGPEKSDDVSHAAAAPKPAAHAGHEDAQLPSPGQALQMLRGGNARFADGRSAHPRADAARLKEVAKGQHPFATVISCSDSRVPVEYVFDQGLGDVFTVRVAGNVCDTSEIGSAEYAVGHLSTPVLLVLGHTACGAVTAVATNATVGGSIPKLVDNIQPAVEAVRRDRPELTGNPLVAAAIRANVKRSIDDLVQRSAVIRERQAEKKLLIAGGVYDLTTGRIEWIELPAGSDAKPAVVAGEKAEADDTKPADDHDSTSEDASHEADSPAPKAKKPDKAGSPKPKADDPH